MNEKYIVDVYFITIPSFFFGRFFFIFMLLCLFRSYYLFRTCVCLGTMGSYGTVDSDNMDTFIVQALFSIGWWFFIHLFLRALSLELSGLPQFWHIVENSLAALTLYRSVGRITRGGVSVVWIYGSVTFVVFVNVSNKQFALCCKCNILRTLFSHLLVQGSKRESENVQENSYFTFMRLFIP